MQPLLINRLLNSTLVLVVLFYTFLPYMDRRVWHAFVPEHQHWLVSKGSLGAQPTTALLATEGDCDACASTSTASLNTGETIIDAFSPSFDLQSFTIVMTLCALLVLTLPRALCFRLATTPLLIKSAALVPLDPPPTSL